VAGAEVDAGVLPKKEGTEVGLVVGAGVDAGVLL